MTTTTYWASAYGWSSECMRAGIGCRTGVNRPADLAAFTLIALGVCCIRLATLKGYR
jgi:hypothetical protein